MFFKRRNNILSQLNNDMLIKVRENMYELFNSNTKKWYYMCEICAKLHMNRQDDYIYVVEAINFFRSNNILLERSIADNTVYKLKSRSNDKK